MTKTLIFQGDSITDAQRVRETPSHLGFGYVSIIAGTLYRNHPGLNLDIINRGVSGHRTCDLVKDWDERCIAHQAQFFSLYIGVNNTWRRYDQNDPTAAEVFEQELRQLLDRTFAETPGLPEKSILVEPFVLDAPAGTKAHWLEEDLAAKQEIELRLAKEYGTLFLPLQSIFDSLLDKAPAAFWAQDGVHPTPAGHALIASEWLKIMEPVLTEVIPPG